MSAEVIQKYESILREHVPDYYVGLIDDRMRQYLLSVGDDVSYAALVELENAYHNKVPIRNSNQFLVGICKKVLQKGIRTAPPPRGGPAPSHGYNPGPVSRGPVGYAHSHSHSHGPSREDGQSPTPNFPMGPAGTGPTDAPAVLPPDLAVDPSNAELEYSPEMPTLMDGVGLAPAVREALEYCVQIRFCQPGDLDSKIVAVFQTLPDDAALRVLNEFVNADISSIRSPTGYMVGIIRKLGVDNVRMPARRFHDCGRLQPNWRPALGAQQRPDSYDQPIAKRPRPSEAVPALGYGAGRAPSRFSEAPVHQYSPHSQYHGGGDSGYFPR